MLMALAATAPVLGAAPDLPEYSTEEANKHIGESATVVGKVECVDPRQTPHRSAIWRLPAPHRLLGCRAR